MSVKIQKYKFIKKVIKILMNLGITHEVYDMVCIE